MNSIYSAEQITVPPQFPSILKAYSKEVLRYNPKDIPAFSRESVEHTYLLIQQRPLFQKVVVTLIERQCYVCAANVLNKDEYRLNTNSP